MIVGNSFVNDSRVEREARSLSATGFNVKVFAASAPTLPKFEKIDGFEVIRLPIKNYSPFWGFYRLVFYKAYRRLVEEKADVYHAHDLDTLLISYFAAKRNNAKIVYDSHEYWSSRTVFKKTYLDTFKGIIREPIFSLIEKSLIKKVDAVITVNETISEKLAEKYGIEKPLSLYNFPSLENQKLSDLLRKSLKLGNKKLILFLGGVNRGRGVLQLVESLRFLSDGFHLVFLGGGPYIKRAQVLAEKFNLSSRVYFLKAVPSVDVLKWASGADVGVSPIQNISTSYYYSSPNKVFEYLMAGLPIAVSNFPEMKRILGKFEVGETFDPEDPEDIAKAVKKISQDPRRYERLKANALKAAREEYNWEMESKKLIDLYKNI
ncbi:MAG: hypothetical protein A2Z42_03455 [Candidatus Woykebacteria bacterium RBG_19FT_COMBO_43_10]|uniref:Glycosyltransferase subfamily 4-like N-terminal domain-containing protein n=1 Tax=Candidatus Woykebacteria bacterium RBG_19FT_COMBO_43_10 TaxID=1802598 RepID=A0A1G1WGI7_9BACT|nr:MAG: hypothetical protein A2Z42_03455 [Candidatus Woykebacteria bacterium RBG_19FT_COMBO_43_10]